MGQTYEFPFSLSHTMRKVLSQAMIALALFALVVAPVMAAPNRSGKQTLVIAIGNDIQNTDVQQIDGTNIVHALIYNRLMQFNLEQTEILPDTLQSYTLAPDGKSLTLVLPKDAKFSNGTVLDANMLQKSIERYRKMSRFSYDLSPITAIQVKDPQTLVLTLEKSSPAMMMALASTLCAPVDTNIANKVSKEEFGQNAISNGLYKLSSWEQGSQIVLTKNPNFKTNFPFVANKGPAKIDKVICRIIPENFTQVSEIEAGNVDILLDVAVSDLPSLEKNPDVKIYEFVSPGIVMLEMNRLKAPFDDINVRRAIACALDRNEMAKAFPGVFVPRYGFLAPSQLCYDAATEAKLKERLEFNQAKAREYLAKAGWKDTNGDGIVDKDGKPFHAVLIVNNLKSFSPILQEQLKRVGMDIEIKQYDGSYILQMLRGSQYDLCYNNFEWQDPAILYTMFVNKKFRPWDNADIEKKLNEARTMMDQKARTKMYSEIQSLMVDELPTIPLFSGIGHFIIRKEVKGLKIGESGEIVFNDMYKE